MKELTAEQKAKAYDEAIKKSKELISRCIDSRDRRTMIYRVDDIEEIFPELKETVDERIRKAVLSALKYLETELGWDFVEDIDILDIYDWLEKQGEQKPSAWSKEDEARIKQLLGWLDTLKNYIHYDALVSLELRRERIDKVSKLESWLKSLKQRLGQGLNPNEVIEWLKPYKCVDENIIELFKKDFKL